jgi:hypothetical protein
MVIDYIKYITCKLLKFYRLIKFIYFFYINSYSTFTINHKICKT